MEQAAYSVDVEFIREQLGPDYDYVDDARQRLHARLIKAVQRPEDVAFHVETPDGDRCVVTICTSDRIGTLSLIAGLFSAYRLDILSVDAFTLRFPQPAAKAAIQGIRRRTGRIRRTQPSKPAPPAQVFLDIFEARPLGGCNADVWRQFEEDLKGLISLQAQGQGERARDQIIERVSEAARDIGVVQTRLLPMSIEVSNTASSDYTQLTIHSTDTPGFLFALTNALALFNLNIGRAQVRTVGSVAQDTFWLTDASKHKITNENRILHLRAATALIKHFTYLLPQCPNPAQALRQFNALTHQMLSRPDWARQMRRLHSTEVLDTLADMMGVSQFLWEDFLRMQHENLFPVVLDTPALSERKPREQMRQECQQAIEQITDHGQQVQKLNSFKDREMFRIDLRHITGRAEFRDFSEELSDLAEIVVEKTAQLAHAALRPQFGVPTLPDGRPCPWVVCALGKFGGRELGFGSDIEMLFVYEEEGLTGGPQKIECSQYFSDFVRSFLGVLKTRREGIFEIDLRLRPFGNKGPLASALNVFRDYYSENGPARQFERMALTKLRPVAGDASLGDMVMMARDAFVYSGKPLDVEDIRHLRQRQATELVPHGAVNAKYSPGGLVDVEYYVQARQISAGHPDASLRVGNTTDAIDKLCASRHISSEDARELRETYGFLRQLIDGLRVVRGHAKDLTIPQTDSREFAYLAHRLQFESAPRLQGAIDARMSHAQSLWE